MKHHIDLRWILLALIIIVTGMSCKKKGKDPNAEIRGNYFSINQFAVDEWNTWSGEPFVIIKAVREGNNKPDTSYTNSDTINWAPIFKAFSETDISNRKYLGQYTFTQFDDNLDYTHNFFYQANDEDLYTQKLLITIDSHSARVTGIYMETLKHSLFSEEIQKLTYYPMKMIQIQTDTKPRFGDKKFHVVTYTFMR